MLTEISTAKVKVNKISGLRPEGLPAIFAARSYGLQGLQPLESNALATTAEAVVPCR